VVKKGVIAWRKTKFLNALRRGSTVIEACAFAGLGSRSTAYEWRKADAAFCDAWDMAEGGAAGKLRHLAFDLARGGNVKLIMWLLEKTDRKVLALGEVVEEVQQIEILGVKEGEGLGEFITFVETEG
jgi:hypothetical protein